MHPLRQHDLHDVAGRDVVLRAPHGGLERVGSRFAFGARHRGRRLVGDRDRGARGATQLLQPLLRTGVRVVLAGIGVDDQGDLAREVVDDRELVGQQQQHVGQIVERARASRLAQRELALDVPHGVVAEIAGEPAAESRQPGLRRRPEAAQELAEERERVAFMALDDAACILDFGERPAHAQPHLGGQADERVAAEALAAHDRFEQERVALLRELQVQRQRRVEVGERLEDERDPVVALRRQRAKLRVRDHAIPPRSRRAALRCPPGGGFRAASLREPGIRCFLRAALMSNRRRAPVPRASRRSSRRNRGCRRSRCRPRTCRRPRRRRSRCCRP